MPDHSEEDQIKKQESLKKALNELAEEWGAERVIELFQELTAYIACSKPVQEGMFNKEELALDCQCIIYRYKQAL